jgi:2-polyprenyl-6-methoxyphenol hydroxylase-like FAD-dependent oxidoreductase
VSSPIRAGCFAGTVDGMNKTYDAIVVGARCAGAPAAMLLARKGYRVLLLDRASFPSDTLSTHMIHAPGVAALNRWGLLGKVRSSGAPPVQSYSLDFGAFTISGTPRPVDGIVTGYAPRRTVLDTILVEAAAAAGVEVRPQFNVDEVLFTDGVVTGLRGHGRSGTPVIETARVVIGADGRNSSVVRAVEPYQYNERPKLQRAYYTYWSNLPVDGFRTFVRPNRGFAAVETNDGLTMLAVGWPYAEAPAYKADVEGNYLATLELAPEFAERVRAARREEQFLGGSVPGYFRKPFGPGWVLVGDAAYNKDPITAQGISDAFHDAEQCARALDAWLSGGSEYDEVMSAYQQNRDARVAGMYDFTAQLATLEPPTPEMQQMLGAVAGSQDSMNAFVSMIAGTMPPEEFFAGMLQAAR